MTIVINIAAAFVGSGVASALIAGNWTLACYGVGVTAILMSMHDVGDTRKSIRKLERGQ